MQVKYEALVYEGLPEITLTLYLRSSNRRFRTTSNKSYGQNVAIDADDIRLENAKCSSPRESAENGRVHVEFTRKTENEAVKKENSVLRRSVEVLRVCPEEVRNLGTPERKKGISKSTDDLQSLRNGLGDKTENEETRVRASANGVNDASAEEGIQWLELGGKNLVDQEDKEKVKLKIDNETDFPSLSASLILGSVRTNGAKNVFKRRHVETSNGITTALGKE